MATKEDILEQIVEEYLLHKGYFVQHNIKFRPSEAHPDFKTEQDSNHSDIDILAYHPQLRRHKRIIAVSCKSWQAGFNPASEIDAIEKNKKKRGREAWRGFRELCSPKWSEAFMRAIKEATGAKLFTHVLAVSSVKGDKTIWEKNQRFSEAIGGNPLKIITFKEMVDEIFAKLEESGTTLAATEVGRLLQMFRAAGLDFNSRVIATPSPGLRESAGATASPEGYKSASRRRSMPSNA